MNKTNITVFGKKINEKICSRLPVRITVKAFPNYVLSDVFAFHGNDKIDNGDGSTSKSPGTSLTQDEIIDYLNKATSFETKETDEEKLLIIDTEHFKFFVVVETKEAQ